MVTRALRRGDITVPGPPWSLLVELRRQMTWRRFDSVLVRDHFIGPLRAEQALI